jgi:hypothetical protein
VFVVRGIVYNQGEASAEDVRVTLTAYGSDGLVVGVRQIAIARLGAGQRHAFSLSLIPPMPAAHVEAVAWGMKESP